MNELRMYVEHLFEGKVLTEEVIELKEEIYGNLMARFEDYLAAGLSEAEALRRTKESFTSVDEVLADEDDEAPVHPAPQSDAAAVEVAGRKDTGMAVLDAGAAEPVRAATPAPTPGAPTPPSHAELADDVVAKEGVATPGRRRRVWPIVVGVVLGVILLGVAAVVGLNVVVMNEVSTTAEDMYQPGGLLDPEDQREYQNTVELDNAVRDSTAATLATHGPGSATDADRDDMYSLVQELPLGTYLTGLSAGQNAVAATYEAVPEAIDGDAIDRAAVYNAAAILAVYPDVVTVRIEVWEAGDDDADAYLFGRDTMERGLQVVSGGSIQTLDRSLLESEDTWDSVRNHVISERFLDIIDE